MLRHVLASRMRHFFGKWRHNSDRMRVAETVNVSSVINKICYRLKERWC
jgi:hypothetical protein